MFKEKLDFALGVSLVFERKTLHNLYRINGTAVKPIVKQQEQQITAKFRWRNIALKSELLWMIRRSNYFKLIQGFISLRVLKPWRHIQLLSGGRQKEVSDHYDTATGTSQIGIWTIVFARFSRAFFDVSQAFSFFLRREMTCFAVVRTTWACDNKVSILPS